MEDSEISSTSLSSNNESYKARGKSIEEWLDELCVYYMALGVSFDEFWYGDYTRLKYYVEANKKRLEARNEELWLQGMYIDNALQAQLANFGKGLSGKNGKREKYIDKPIDLFPKTEEEKEAEAEQERQELIRYFNSLIDKQNARKAAEKAKGDLKQGEKNGS